MDRLEALLSFFQEDPDDEFTRFAIAQEYAKRGDHPRSLAFYEALVSDKPEYVGSYYHLGKLYLSLDRKEDAIQTFRDGIDIAAKVNDFHARAELQAALQDALGIGFD